MADSGTLAILRKGVNSWNPWKRKQFDPFIDLSGVDLNDACLIGFDLSSTKLNGTRLRGAHLTEADLSGADLSEADLFGAHLSRALLNRADLRKANLIGAHLSMAHLSKTNLSGANLGGADLSQSDLSNATLVGADLTGADLSKASFGWTTFGSTQLISTIGLDSSKHLALSYLDYHTLVESGTLPLPFLRGCGLSDQFIEFLPSLLNQAVQFYSCFISYSANDQEFADRLYADLQNHGVRCWFAPHDIQGGKKINEQIEEAIRVYERLLLILSGHSMSSRWVKTEIANARKKELEQRRQVLFPIRLVDFEAIRPWKLFDADIGDDSAGEIREYFIPDFSNWKHHDSYKEAFQRLLRDLKAESDRCLARAIDSL